MKKLLTLILMMPLLLKAQSEQPILHVDDSTTVFDYYMSAGNLVYDEETQNLWQLDTACYPTDSLAGVGKLKVNSGGGSSIYTANDTIGSNRVAAITDSLTLGSQLKIDDINNQIRINTTGLTNSSLEVGKNLLNSTNDAVMSIVGASNWLNFTNKDTSTINYGGYFQSSLINNSGDSVLNNRASLIGVGSRIYTSGNHYIGLSQGVNSSIYQIDTNSVINNHHSYYAGINGGNLGTINNWVGLYISDPRGLSNPPTNRWGIYQADNGWNYFDGNIGVGVIQPSERLHVKGFGSSAARTTVKVSDNTGEINFEIIDDGEVNSRLGYWVGGEKVFHLTGSSSVVSNQNVWLGQNAGKSISSGLRNVSIGSRSGQFLTTGNNNTFIGTDAGRSLTNGSDNILIGYASGSTGNFSKSVGIGRSTIIVNNNTVVTGSSQVPYINYYFGRGVQQSSSNIGSDGVIFNATSVESGESNITSSFDFKIRASAGTGTGEGGWLSLQTAPAGASGSTQNSYVNALIIKPNPKVVSNVAFETESKVVHNTITIDTDTVLDDNAHIIFVEDGTFTITLPTAEDGREVILVNKELLTPVNITIDVSSGLINGLASINISVGTLGGVTHYYSDGTNWYGGN